MIGKSSNRDTGFGISNNFVVSLKIKQQEEDEEDKEFCLRSLGRVYKDIYDELFL